VVPDEGIVNAMPQTGELAPALPPQQTALALSLAIGHLDELDTADLPLPDGRTLPITTRSEVLSWLEGLRARCRAGERL
jgi:hypothetical protein